MKSLKIHTRFDFRESDKDLLCKQNGLFLVLVRGD